MFRRRLPSFEQITMIRYLLYIALSDILIHRFHGTGAHLGPKPVLNLNRVYRFIFALPCSDPDVTRKHPHQAPGLGIHRSFTRDCSVFHATTPPPHITSSLSSQAMMLRSSLVRSRSLIAGAQAARGGPQWLLAHRVIGQVRKLDSLPPLVLTSLTAAEMLCRCSEAR